MFTLINLRSGTNQIDPKNHNVKISGDTTLLSIRGFSFVIFLCTYLPVVMGNLPVVGRKGCTPDYPPDLLPLDTGVAGPVCSWLWRKIMQTSA